LYLISPDFLLFYVKINSPLNGGKVYAPNQLYLIGSNFDQTALYHLRLIKWEWRNLGLVFIVGRGGIYVTYGELVVFFPGLTSW